MHISSNDEYKGKFTFYNEYREGIKNVFSDLEPHFHLSILSGDNAGEKRDLKSYSHMIPIFYSTKNQRIN